MTVISVPCCFSKWVYWLFTFVAVDFTP